MAFADDPAAKFHEYLVSGDVPAVRRYLRDPRLRPHLHLNSLTPEPALITAIRLHHTDLVALLLRQSDINANAIDGHGHTATHYAVAHASVEYLHALLSRPDLDLSVKNAQGQTAYDACLSRIKVTGLAHSSAELKECARMLMARKPKMSPPSAHFRTEEKKKKPADTELSQRTFPTKIHFRMRREKEQEKADLRKKLKTNNNNYRGAKKKPLHRRDLRRKLNAKTEELKETRDVVSEDMVVSVEVFEVSGSDIEDVQSDVSENL